MEPKIELSRETIAMQKDMDDRQAALDSKWDELLSEQHGIQKLPVTEISERQIARGQEIKRLLFGIQQQDAALLVEKINFCEKVELPERIEIDNYRQAQPEIVKPEVFKRCLSIGYTETDHTSTQWDDVRGCVSPNMLYRHPLHLDALAAAENSRAQVNAVHSRIATHRERLKTVLDQLETAKTRLLAI